jgi:uncharacterized protein YcfL
MKSMQGGRTVVLALIALMCVVCSAGGDSDNNPVHEYYVYVTNCLSDNVSAYAINTTTGALQKVSGSPFAAGNYPCSITIVHIDQ